MDSPNASTITGKKIGDVTVVELEGEFTAQNTTETQEKVLAEPDTKMILDMTKVSFMSSAGLRMLLTLYRRISGRAGKILLVGLSEDLRSTMSMTGFLDLFHHHPTLEDGLAELGSSVRKTR